MFHRILVPLDGSPRAEQALPAAASLARASGGSLILLRVVNAPPEVAPYPGAGIIPPETTRTVVDVNLEGAEDYLSRISHAHMLANITTQTEAVWGEAASMILASAEKHQSDLIVMCSHGYTGLKRWFLGSVAEKVAHHATMPVLMLRENGLPLAESGQATPRSLRLLLPLDGSQLAQEAIEPAAQLVTALSSPEQGHLHLAQVVVPPAAEEGSLGERNDIIHRAGQYLEMVEEQIRGGQIAPAVTALNLKLTWSVTIDDDIAAAIVRLAEDGEEGLSERCDIIAMTSHGRTGLQRWVMGSVTERVLHATQVPMLIVRHPQSDNAPAH